jgi:hypothetical protein
MSCSNRRENYIAKATSNEISWQGNAVPELDICIGDSLTRLGNIILDKIKEILKGKGIILTDLSLDDCEYIKDILGLQEKNLLNILNSYKEAICTLKEDTDINSENLINFTNVALYTLGCIDPEDDCGDPLTFKQLIQSIIDKLCQLDTQFQSIAQTILEVVEEGAGNFIGGGAIKSCGGNGLVISGTGETTVVTFQALVPPNCPIIYRGSTSFFDVNGIGLPNTPYCGWYLCNGANGTPSSSSLPQNNAGNITYIIRFT